MILGYVKAFLIGAVLCMIGQVLIDKDTKTATILDFGQAVPISNEDREGGLDLLTVIGKADWGWLAAQPGGASVALRKLVENALREAEGPDRVRASREAAYRFMTAMAGDQPGYEEATRMLFAGDWVAFDAAIEAWPADVRDYARRLAEGGWRNGQGR